ncbi:hypothetical protein SLEP1_g30695 [Rubroshorea leprosula]|uniref:Uncharacterized protein n=1 Tax=Rubroshorea leprosula TaxID=152421 RepID=A0AAV5K6V8_9ROSI|nr:hypothetical protein SLEP1_g30695 [Rubroshorea leprosula]
MDTREQELQPLGICERLYNFFTRSLAAYALKTVTLGLPHDHAPASAPVSSGVEESSSNTNKPVHPVAPETWSAGSGLQGKVEPERAKSSSSDHIIDRKELLIQDTSPEKEEEEEEAQLPANAFQAKAPKKVVSINETLEEIKLSKKKRKRKKSAEKVASFEDETDKPKLLKSILKVGSINLNENSYMDHSPST